MGKEHEVLQAAQDGNLSKLESLFTQRQSKVFAGLFKGPNINWRDDSGCTALHLAALNGHREAVIFLLHNDASANTPDNAGSFPLHLAAFNGHHEVAKILITRGPSHAVVNEPNMAGDTALHVASQYGHRYVVQVLLENHADASLRNTKEETALDLAAQYGRLSTVQLFLFYDSALLQNAVHKHSPLHLAARNGHEDVVKILLDGGMPINATCDMGTALHCAALFGKVSVAKLLLQRGIDIDIEDDNGQNALALLCKHPSQRSQEITALIYAQSTAESDEREKTRSPAASYSGVQFEVVEAKRHNIEPVGANTKSKAVRPAGYDIVPPPRPRPKDLDADNDENNDKSERTYSLIHGPVLAEDGISNAGDENYDLASITPLKNDKNESFFDGDRNSNSPKGDYCLVGDVQSIAQYRKETDGVKQFRRLTLDRPTEKNLKQNRISSKDIDDGTYCVLSPQIPNNNNNNDNVQNNVEFSSKPLTSRSKTDSFTRSKQTRTSDNVYRTSLPPNSVYQAPPSSDTVYETPPSSESIYQIPPSSFFEQRTSRTSIPDFPPPSPRTAENLIGEAFQPSQKTGEGERSIGSNNIKHNRTMKMRSQTLPTNVPSQQGDMYDNVNINNAFAQQDTYDNVNLSNSPAPSLSYDNVNITNRPEQTNATNLTLTQDSYYQAPPCTILKEKPTDLFEKKPVNQTQQYTSVKTKSMKQKRTGTLVNREISIEDIDENKEIVKSKPNAQEEVNKDVGPVEVEKSEVDQPVPKPRKVKQNRTSMKSISTGYRMSSINQQVPLDESYEWNKIDSFLSDLEKFAESPKEEDNQIPGVMSTDSVAAWLSSLNLAQYEPMFLTNGFDDMDFLGGSLEDQDLIELGILHSEHRKKLIEASNFLAKPPVIGDDNFSIPTSVGEWLTKLKLGAYEERFIYNGYGNIDRVRVIWELELVTVLDITTLGHRKRMINSLGRRPAVIKSDVSWAKKFADADAGKRKSAFLDNSMEYAQQLLKTAEGLKKERAQRQASRGDSVDGPVFKERKEEQADTESYTAPHNVITTSPRTQQSVDREHHWKHNADLLLYESVCYKTQYLGSHPVQIVKGVSSTLDACAKMKAISKNVHKMPTISLSISVRGIDYIDSNSKMIISQYPINHISFCAQDPGDSHVIAYITRDQHTRKNYCHVFRTDSADLSDEIVMTIGQCFELAYEQHVAMLEIKKTKEAKEKAAEIKSKPSETPVIPERKPREPPPKPIPYAERMMLKNSQK